jgi:hypothetical protein
MKQIIFSVIISIAMPAWAQADKPVAKEPAKEAVKPVAEQPPKQAAATPRKSGPRRWHEDARHCLERPSNTEIIKCAEEYL